MTEADRLELRRLLPKAPTRRMRRRLFRYVPLLAYERGEPPTFLYASGRPNRCNPRGVSCLYFSEDERTAATEYRHAWRGTQAEDRPKLVFVARVSFRRVVDLGNAEARRFLDLEEEDLFGSWRMRTRPTRLQEIGDAIGRQKAVAAIRYPSVAARHAGEPGWNLAIFPPALEALDRVEILGDSEVPLEVLP